MLLHDLKDKAESLIGSTIAWMDEYIDLVSPPIIYTPATQRKAKGTERPRLIIHIIHP